MDISTDCCTCWAQFIGGGRCFQQSSFSKLSVTSSNSQLILQPFRCFTYVTVHSPTLPLLYLRHSSFSNPSIASPTSQFILQPFSRFCYVTSSSLNSPGRARHNSFSNPSVALPASQLVLQPCSCFTYVTHFTYIIDNSPTSYTLHLRHRHFTYVIDTSPTS